MLMLSSTLAGKTCWWPHACLHSVLPTGRSVLLHCILHPKCLRFVQSQGRQENCRDELAGGWCYNYISNLILIMQPCKLWKPSAVAARSTKNCCSNFHVVQRIRKHFYLETHLISLKLGNEEKSFKQVLCSGQMNFFKGHLQIVSLCFILFIFHCH